MNPVNSSSQWNPQGQPGGFQSDAGIPNANRPRVAPPRPVNAQNMSGSISNRNFDKMYAKDYNDSTVPQPLGADNAGSSTYRG